MLNSGDRAMIKDLVVNLTPGTDLDPAAQFAISIAAKFEAHVAGIAFAYDPVITPTVMDGLSAAWVDAQRTENRATAEKAVDRFEAAAKRQGLSAEHRIIEASIGGAANLFGRIARRFDLAVVGQTAPERMLPDDLLIEAALFESGRPVVVVPYIQREDLKLDHVLVCWDGSRNAARAIADSLPFLMRTNKVEIIIVGSGSGKADELPGADIGEHLARHDLNVGVKRLVAADVDVSNIILSYVVDCAADFIVMGGYGHSRLREFVLGGATRGILQSMTVPVLMAH
jgi:nucleotide-binding universal stress UspA family protein